MRSHNYSQKLILTIFLVIILLQFSLAHSGLIIPVADPAETIDATTEDDGPSLPIPPKEDSKTPINPEKVLSAAEKATQEGLTKGANISSIDSVPLSDILQNPTKSIFGIKDKEEISLEKFIVLVGVLILLILFLYSILSMVAPFSNYIIWIISILFPIAFGMAGIINEISKYIFSSITLFNISTLVIIIIILVILLIFSRGARERLRSLRLSKSIREGQKFRENKEFINILGKSLKEK
jgi:hypothetical protein